MFMVMYCKPCNNIFCNSCCKRKNKITVDKNPAAVLDSMTEGADELENNTCNKNEPLEDFKLRFDNHLPKNDTSAF